MGIGAIRIGCERPAIRRRRLGPALECGQRFAQSERIANLLRRRLDRLFDAPERGVGPAFLEFEQTAPEQRPVIGRRGGQRLVVEPARFAQIAGLVSLGCLFQEVDRRHPLLSARRRVAGEHAARGRRQSFRPRRISRDSGGVHHADDPEGGIEPNRLVTRRRRLPGAHELLAVISSPVSDIRDDFGQSRPHRHQGVAETDEVDVDDPPQLAVLRQHVSGRQIVEKTEGLDVGEIGFQRAPHPAQPGSQALDRAGVGRRLVRIVDRFVVRRGFAEHIRPAPLRRAFADGCPAESAGGGQRADALLNVDDQGRHVRHLRARHRRQLVHEIAPRQPVEDDERAAVVGRPRRQHALHSQPKATKAIEIASGIGIRSRSRTHAQHHVSTGRQRHAEDGIAALRERLANQRDRWTIRAARLDQLRSPSFVEHGKPSQVDRSGPVPASTSRKGATRLLVWFRSADALPPRRRSQIGDSADRSPRLVTDMPKRRRSSDGDEGQMRESASLRES